MLRVSGLPIGMSQVHMTADTVIGFVLPCGLQRQHAEGTMLCPGLGSRGFLSKRLKNKCGFQFPRRLLQCVSTVANRTRHLFRRLHRYGEQKCNGECHASLAPDTEEVTVLTESNRRKQEVTGRKYLIKHIISDNFHEIRGAGKPCKTQST